MKILVKNNQTGTTKEFMFPDNLPAKEVQRIKDYLANGGLAKRDFSISSRQANKAYVPLDSDITLVANGLGQDEAWVKENLYFVKMVASDTTVDLQWDKFSESVIRALGVQYSEGWVDGEIGGRTQCVMHDREKIVGRTYRYEVIDAVDKEGNPILDENNTGVKQLIVYAYVTMSAHYKGEPIVNFLKDGRLCKVSISAWISGWQYIPSDQSNWIPPGESEVSGYFFYPDGNMVEAIELSFVDMGANQNAQLTKANKIATVTVDETPEATKSETKETENEPIDGEGEDKEQNDKNLHLDINIAEYNSMKALWDSLPGAIRKGTTAVKWVAVTLKNHGDGKEFFAPDYCATKFTNMDRTLGLQKTQIKELEAKVEELEGKVSENGEKALGYDLDKKEYVKDKAEKQAKIDELKAALTEVEKQLGVEKAFYTDKFVTVSAQLEGTTNDSDAIEALKGLAEGMNVADLRVKSSALSVQLMNKKHQSSINPIDEPIKKKTF